MLNIAYHILYHNIPTDLNLKDTYTYFVEEQTLLKIKKNNTDQSVVQIDKLNGIGNTVVKFIYFFPCSNYMDLSSLLIKCSETFFGEKSIFV